MKEKIAMTFVAVIMVAMLVLTGCATTYSEDELNAYAGSKVSDANTKSQLQLDTMSNELESVKASLETAVSDKEVLQLSYNDVVAEKAALEDEKETATEIEAVENSVLFMSDDLDVESPFDKSIRFDTTSIRFDGDTYSIKEYVEIDVGEYINIENDPSNELIEITFWERGKSSSKTRFFKLYDALNVSSEVKA